VALEVGLGGKAGVGVGRTRLHTECHALPVAQVACRPPLPQGGTGLGGLPVDVIHQREQLGHHPPLHVPLRSIASTGYGVDLVKKEDAGGGRAGIIKELSQVGLALSRNAGDELRGRGANQGHPAGVGEGGGEGSLAAPGRSMEEDAAGGVDPKPSVDFRVGKGERHLLRQRLHGSLKAPEVGKGDRRWRLCEELSADGPGRGLGDDSDGGTLFPAAPRRRRRR